MTGGPTVQNTAPSAGHTSTSSMETSTVPVIAEPPIITLPNGISLRPFAHADIDDQIRGLNNPAVRTYLRNRIPNPVTEVDARWWIDHCNNLSSWVASGPWQANGETNLKARLLPSQYAITQDNKQIGAIGFELKDDIYFRTAELGYWLAEPYWGKGIMGTVVKAFVQWVFENFGIVYRLEAQIAAHNLGSAAVVKKAGFVFEGRKIGSVWKGGKCSDEDMYGIVRQKELGA